MKGSMFNNQRLIIATILGDSGDYYKSSYYNRTWIEENFNLHGGLIVYDCWRKAWNCYTINLNKIFNKINDLWNGLFYSKKKTFLYF